VADGAAFGTGTPTVTETATGGTLNKNATYSFKVTRKDLQRGFEEAISYTHTHATTNAGSNTYKLTFAFPSTAGYVYNIYFDTVQAGSGASAADTALKLVASNIAASASVEVTAIATTGTTAPDHNTSGKTIHPVYFIGEEACNWVGLQDLKTYVTTDQSTLSDVLNQLKGCRLQVHGQGHGPRRHAHPPPGGLLHLHLVVPRGGEVGSAPRFLPFGDLKHG
jgi:hypothetical protein